MSEAVRRGAPKSDRRNGNPPQGGGPVAEPVDLTRLKVGARARLHGTLLDRADFELLEALGLTDACHLRVCQAGDPWIVQVRATRIGIADSLAPSILVIPE